MKYAPSKVKNSFNFNANNASVISRYIIRPLSFYMTSFALELNMKPDQATAISLALNVMSAFAFITGTRIFFTFGVLLYFLAVLFDFVDGNIARITDSATYFGKFADGAVDVFADSFIPLAVAVGFYFAGSSVAFLLMGIGASMFLLFGFFVINRASFMCRWVKIDELEGKLPPAGRPDNLNPLKSGMMPLYAISNVAMDAKILVLATAAITGMTTALFIILFTVIAVWAAALTIGTALDMVVRLKIHRVSKSDLRLRQKRS
ncbi:MAG: CDP-alcohol phosphatidyltransferase family protein [Candidatus Omnitrophica bacterium]|nr:CDP-alcohol phosphatidyltransferase family protein [Candidatus Omnitrophota bacterium]